MAFLVNLYAQHIFRDATQGRYQSIFDVETISTHRVIDSVWRLATGRLSPLNTASMISIDFRTDSTFRPREGSWYQIDASAFANALDTADSSIRAVQPDENGASYIRTAIIATAPLQFTGTLIDPKNVDLPRPDDKIWPEMRDDGSLRLTVANCGQGNWNEVSNSEFRLIFDTGADRWFCPNEVSRFVRTRRLHKSRKRTLILISHWDIDHFHALLRFRPCDLASVYAVIGPSKIPNTATYKKVREMLTSHNIPLYAVPFAARLPGAGRQISLLPYPITARGVVRVFHSTRGASRNQTGVVVTAHGNSKIAVLTGDHHYEKIFAAVAPHCSTAPCLLVAPHHGGRAGELDAAQWKSTLRISATPISVGNGNPFGHPFDDITSKLHSLTGSAPWETRKDGTYTALLS